MHEQHITYTSTCDRCGRLEKGPSVQLGFATIEYMSFSESMEVDLCSACMAEFKKWVKDAG